jgi:hypothetical protein
MVVFGRERFLYNYSENTETKRGESAKIRKALLRDQATKDMQYRHTA